MTDPCATGGVCDFTAPGGNICIDANADTDGDGLINAVDHCPNVPGGKYDEDGDGIGDDCDKCPIAPPPAVPDPDGDDVDSPCDPDPETPGDKILLFEGFGDGVVPMGWTPTTPAAWSAVDGELIVSLASVATEDYIKVIVAPLPNLAVEMSYRVDKLESSTATHMVVADAIDVRPAGIAQFECGVVRNDNGTGDIVDLNTDQASTSQGTMNVDAFNSAGLYRSAAYSSAGSVGCTVIGDNMGLATVQANITPDALGEIAVGARGVTARFEWVLVVGRAN